MKYLAHFLIKEHHVADMGHLEIGGPLRLAPSPVQGFTFYRSHKQGYGELAQGSRKGDGANKHSPTQVVLVHCFGCNTQQQKGALHYQYLLTLVKTL